jgi:hypothetical protein
MIKEPGELPIESGLVDVLVPGNLEIIRQAQRPRSSTAKREISYPASTIAHSGAMSLEGILIQLIRNG